MTGRITYDAGLATGEHEHWMYEDFTTRTEALAAALEWAALRISEDRDTPDAFLIATTDHDEDDDGRPLTTVQRIAFDSDPNPTI